ncbi:hypothetical protein DRJ48_04500 [Candidatus Woesearchaeota archaeon]|nr:MAG: hypothetical protein DRJ48_04500 [Candidatus Woesearchaeota archaeon]
MRACNLVEKVSRASSAIRGGAKKFGKGALVVGAGLSALLCTYMPQRIVSAAEVGNALVNQDRIEHIWQGWTAENVGFAMSDVEFHRTLAQNLGIDQYALTMNGMAGFRFGSKETRLDLSAGVESFRLIDRKSDESMGALNYTGDLTLRALISEGPVVPYIGGRLEGQAIPLYEDLMLYQPGIGGLAGVMARTDTTAIRLEGGWSHTWSVLSKRMPYVTSMPGTEITRLNFEFTTGNLTGGFNVESQLMRVSESDKTTITSYLGSLEYRNGRWMIGAGLKGQTIKSTTTGTKTQTSWLVKGGYYYNGSGFEIGFVQPKQSEEAKQLGIEEWSIIGSVNVEFEL